MEDCDGIGGKFSVFIDLWSFGHATSFHNIGLSRSHQSKNDKIMDYLLIIVSIYV